jgi:hypothetical protein
MKKLTVSSSTLVLIGLISLSLIAVKCTKVGVLANQLDRSFVGTPDSSIFSPFYDVTKISVADATPDAHDSIVAKGVLNTIKEYCGVSTCHGGPISPKLSTYAQISLYVTPGNPEASKLWQLITTNDLNKTMPPVNAQHELSLTDKNIIYNWIKNGAKEQPDLVDFRPAAIHAISVGCTSGNCHSVATSTGSWARAGLISSLTSADTSQFALIRTSGITYYCTISNASLRQSVWDLYKDSVRRFYADTVANASFRPYKTFGTPVVKSSVRGSLSSYDDIVMDICYPKGQRSNSSVVYTDANGKKFYVKGNYLNTGSGYFLARIDSTILPANPFTGVWTTTNNGDMAYSDGGLTRSDIALVKAWYFADPNIPDVWKYGNNNTGIFKFKKSGNIITKH